MTKRSIRGLRKSHFEVLKENMYLKLSTIIGTRGISLEYIINTVDRNITSARSEIVEASDVVDIPTINNSDYTADHVTYFKMYFKNVSLTSCQLHAWCW